MRPSIYTATTIKPLACLNMMKGESYSSGMRSIGVLSDPKDKLQIFDTLKKLYIHFYGGN